MTAQELTDRILTPLIELRPGESVQFERELLAKAFPDVSPAHGGQSTGVAAALAGIGLHVGVEPGDSTNSIRVNKVAYAQPPTIGRWKGNIAKNYLADRIDTPGWHREHGVVEQYLQKLPDGGAVLDVPFGTGRFVDLYHAKQMTVSGVDISQAMCDAAKAALGEVYDRCDVQVASSDHMPFPNNAFDLLVCVRLLTGIVSFEVALASLREFRRVTNGHVIILLRNRAPDAPMSESPAPHDKMAASFSRDEIVAFLRRNDFSIVEETLCAVQDSGQEKRAYLLSTGA